VFLLSQTLPPFTAARASSLHSPNGLYSNIQGILLNTIIPNVLICTPKVSNVLCSKSGGTSSGTLHLTAHHLIFSYTDFSQSEMWASPVLYFYNIYVILIVPHRSRTL